MKRGKLKGLFFIEKYREYLDYLEDHLHNIYKSFYEIKHKCKDLDIIKNKKYLKLLEEKIYNHDLSKFSQDEFVLYIKFFTLKEISAKELEPAWKNHLKNNDHHWENIVNYNVNSLDWKIAIIHMIIDWNAMGYLYGDNAKIYYENNKDKIHLTKDAVSYMYFIFELLYK